jgi:hypothetical protein
VTLECVVDTYNQSSPWATRPAVFDPLTPTVSASSATIERKLDLFNEYFIKKLWIDLIKGGAATLHVLLKFVDLVTDEADAILSSGDVELPQGLVGPLMQFTRGAQVVSQLGKLARGEFSHWNADFVTTHEELRAKGTQEGSMFHTTFATVKITPFYMDVSQQIAMNAGALGESVPKLLEMEAAFKLCDADSATSLLDMVDAIGNVVIEFACVQQTFQLLGGDLATKMNAKLSGCIEVVLGKVMADNQPSTLELFSRMLANVSDVMPFDPKIPEAQGIVGEAIRTMSAAARTVDLVAALGVIKDPSDVEDVVVVALASAHSKLAGTPLADDVLIQLVEVIDVLLQASVHGGQSIDTVRTAVALSSSIQQEHKRTFFKIGQGLLDAYSLKAAIATLAQEAKLEGGAEGIDVEAAADMPAIVGHMLKLKGVGNKHLETTFPAVQKEMVENHIEDHNISMDAAATFLKAEVDSAIRMSKAIGDHAFRKSLARMTEVLAPVEDVAFGLIGKEHWDGTMKADESKSFPKIYALAAKTILANKAVARLRPAIEVLTKATISTDLCFFYEVSSNPLAARAMSLV